MDTRWLRVQMDHTVSGGHKHGGLIHQSVVGRGDDSFTLHNLVKKLQQMQAGRSENRRSSKTRRKSSEQYGLEKLPWGDHGWNQTVVTA